MKGVRVLGSAAALSCGALLMIMAASHCAHASETEELLQEVRALRISTKAAIERARETDVRFALGLALSRRTGRGQVLARIGTCQAESSLRARTI